MATLKIKDADGQTRSLLVEEVEAGLLAPAHLLRLGSGLVGADRPLPVTVQNAAVEPATADGQAQILEVLAHLLENGLPLAAGAATVADQQATASILEAVRDLLAQALTVTVEALPDGLAQDASVASVKTAVDAMAGLLKAALPLPTGAATVAAQQAMTEKIEAVRTLLANALKVDVQALPAGLATDAGLGALGEILINGLDVTVANQPAGLAQDTSVAAVKTAVDAVAALLRTALPLPSGAASAAKQDDATDLLKRTVAPYRYAKLTIGSTALTGCVGLQVAAAATISASFADGSTITSFPLIAGFNPGQFRTVTAASVTDVWGAFAPV